MRAPLAVYRMTSEQLGGVWPLIAADGLPPTGAWLGIDWLSGGAFYADPIGWTLSGTAGVTNPNMIVFGAPGRGKTGTVKRLALRLMAYGYRALILGDVKDEYEILCRGLGVAPRAVGPACRRGSTRWTSARSAATGGGCRPGRRSAARRSCSPVGWC